MGSGNASALNAIKNNDLPTVLGYLLKMPGVKVDRTEFLAKMFKVSSTDIVNNNYYASFELRKKCADRRIRANVRNSTSFSFMSGLPGGVAIAGTIPADILQNMIYSIRLIQELAYIYDYQDLVDADDNLNSDAIILFMGIMFGAQGAASVLRVMSKNAAQNIGKKIMNTALTKTTWYPVLKKITSIVASETLTKKGLAGIASKSIPVVGGVASGGITLVTMKHQANRLNNEFLESFGKDYNDEDYQRDVKIIQGEYEETNKKERP